VPNGAKTGKTTVNERESEKTGKLRTWISQVNLHQRHHRRDAFTMEIEQSPRSNGLYRKLHAPGRCMKSNLGVWKEEKSAGGIAAKYGRWVSTVFGQATAPQVGEVRGIVNCVKHRVTIGPIKKTSKARNLRMSNENQHEIRI